MNRTAPQPSARFGKSKWRPSRASLMKNEESSVRRLKSFGKRLTTAGQEEDTPPARPSKPGSEKRLLAAVTGVSSAVSGDGSTCQHAAASIHVLSPTVAADDRHAQLCGQGVTEGAQLLRRRRMEPAG